MPLNDIQSELTKEQKTGFVLLLLFAIFTVVLGFLQLRNTLYSPFIFKFTEGKNGAATIEDEATRLQSIDTDRDGLNDYDEINYYQTSAYLPDTDSDGKTDKQEVDAKTDPLCAEGKNCEDLLPSADEITPALLDKAARTATPLDVTGPISFGASATSTADADVEALLQDPKKLREYLVKTGKITPEQLANIDDATLLEAFQQASQKQTATSAPTPSQP